MWLKISVTEIRSVNYLSFFPVHKNTTQQNRETTIKNDQFSERRVHTT